VGADSIGIIDANDSNASRKESIADLISAVAGSGLAASSGQLTVSSANTAAAMVTGGNLTAADAAQQIIAMQVFS
jgi:flagellar basal body rod protein FlgC